MAIAVISKPTLSIAHVTKQSADPNHPFGSIFWSNGARVTIAVSRQKPDEPDSPRVLRNAKTNQRGPFRTVAIDWSWLSNDHPGVPVKDKPYNTLVERDAYSSDAEAVRDAWAILGREPASEEEVEQITGRSMTSGNFRTSLSRARKHAPVSITRVKPSDG
jgi:hypothetical protein